MRETTIRRVEWYFGPSGELTEEDLGVYERQGGWVLEPKYDGMWCALLVGENEHVLTSRDARTGPISGSNRGDLHLQPLPGLAGTVLIGELEAATQASKEIVEARGFRCLRVFDIAKLNSVDLRDKPWSFRRALLEELAPSLSDRFLLTPYYERGFVDFYRRFLEDENGEGVVIKKTTSTLRSKRSDGKTSDWLRCKRWFTRDYVLAGISKTAGGKYSAPKKTGVWGFYRNGTLVPIIQAGCDASLLTEENVGKLVAEFRGAAVFDSGALRHAQFVRVRHDKTPDLCTSI